MNTALVNLKPLLEMKPAFDWFNNSLKRSILTYSQKRYHINFIELDKLIGSENKIEYYRKEHNVKIHATNKGSSKMLLIIYANRLDVNIGQVAQPDAHFALRLKPI
jgi:hypothetical protein